MYGYYVEPLFSLTIFAENLLVEILILLKYVLQEPMILYRISTIPIPIDADTYVGNSNEYS